MDLKKYHIISGLVTLVFIVGFYHTLKPLPEGIDYHSEDITGEVRFLHDLTNQDGHEQMIFDTIFTHIDEAKEYILIDMFLFNPHLGKADSSYRSLSGELTQKLIDKRDASPDVKIDFITDEINDAYGGDISEQITMMQDAGVNVIRTDLRKLRDSNPAYSPFWRIFIQWFGNSERFGIFPHPFADDRKVTLRSYLKLLNFKANHRKTFIADDGDSWVSIVMSANPHDGSSAHSNVAWEIRGDFADELFRTEKAVAEFSRKELSKNSLDAASVGDTKMKLVTEKSIRDELLKEIDALGEEDEISIAMFYLSDRKIIKSLLRASDRGVSVSLILDPNKDAFGYEKNGVPNRPVAHELIKKSGGKIKVRWYDTNGEQFHTKLIYINGKKVIIILGSANLTDRNLGNKNLETDVVVYTENGSELDIKVQAYFEQISQDGYTLDYSAYADNSFFKTLMYRFQEFTGLCSF